MSGLWTPAGLYRVSRMLHAYLSAFAFVSLLLFSVTGLLLNHPEWLTERGQEVDLAAAVPPSAVQAALQAEAPLPALAVLLGAHAELVGRYTSGELFDDEALLQFQGPRGATTVAVSLETGAVELTRRRAPLLAFLNDLHTGKDSGPVWRAFIDASAAVFILLSVIGYVLFFSLRFRLRTSLALTALSLAMMVGLVWLFVA